MAKADKDDKDEELNKEENEAPKSKKRPAILKIVAIVVGVLVLVSTTVGVSVYVTSKMVGDSSADNTDHAPDEKKAAKGDKADKEKKGGKKGAKGGEVIYYAFDPPFVVNFQQQGGTRFLQVTIEVMAHDAAVVTALQTHMPIIRNNLVLMLSNQTADRLMTMEGKQKIRAEALAEVQAVLEERFGKPGVEELYFTSFVMQ